MENQLREIQWEYKKQPKNQVAEFLDQLNNGGRVWLPYQKRQSEQIQDPQIENLSYQDTSRPLPLTTRNPRLSSKSQRSPRTNVRSTTRKTTKKGKRKNNIYKTYNKLVKNYLLDNGYSLEEVMENYSTNYYPIIGFIKIKYIQRIDFQPIYSDKVKQEVKVQQKKLDKHLQCQKMIKEQIMQKSGLGIETGELQIERQKVDKKIKHLQTTIKYIKISQQSCTAFFKENNTEKALRILYLKDNNEIWKKDQFDNALQKIKKFQRLMYKKYTQATFLQFKVTQMYSN